MKTSIELDKVRKQLPFGAQTEIAKRCNVKVTQVNRVLNGKAENTQILEAVADYLSEIKSHEERVINRLSSLID